MFLKRRPWLWTWNAVEIANHMKEMGLVSKTTAPCDLQIRARLRSISAKAESIYVKANVL